MPDIKLLILLRLLSLKKEHRIFFSGGLSIMSHTILRLWLTVLTKHDVMLWPFRQLSVLLVECRPAVLMEGVQTSDGETKNFHSRLSSAETQQPVARMRHKPRGRLVLSVLFWRSRGRTTDRKKVVRSASLNKRWRGAPSMMPACDHSRNDWKGPDLCSL